MNPLSTIVEEYEHCLDQIRMEIAHFQAAPSGSIGPYGVIEAIATLLIELDREIKEDAEAIIDAYRERRETVK